MSFKERLTQGHSKEITLSIVNEVCKKPKKMDEFMQTFINGPMRITQRAAWPLGFIAQKKPELLNPYYPILIKELDNIKNHQAVTRNIIRAFQYTVIPKKYQGEILDRCFKFLSDGNQPIAVKAFSMTVAYNLSKEYPDIIPELRASIENILPEGSVGIKSRGKKILKQLNKV